MQIGQDSTGKLCPILLCNRWGTFNVGAGITFWKLTCSHTWCPGWGDSHSWRLDGWSFSRISFSVCSLTTRQLQHSQTPHLLAQGSQGVCSKNEWAQVPGDGNRLWWWSSALHCKKSRRDRTLECGRKYNLPHLPFFLWSIFDASSSGSISFLMVFWLLSGLDLCLHVLPIALRYNSLNLGSEVKHCHSLVSCTNLGK